MPQVAAKIKCLVTGGAGFLGQRLVKQLIEHGKYDVTVFDIRPCNIEGATTIIGDLRKLDDVVAALEGKRVVFHCATAAPTGENATNKSLMYSVNVVGTQNIIEACQKNGVEKLVFTSSASVVFDGKPLHNIDESAPYATRPMDHYTFTKIESERLVLAANTHSGLSTCALRPSGIFGEGDLVFVPTVVRNAQNGKMKYVIGDGKNNMDFTYVGNVARAHILAADNLFDKSPVAGQAYFITNNEPVPFWTMMGNVCEGLGYSRPTRHLPFAMIFIIVCIFEYIISPLLKLFIRNFTADFTINRILISTTNRTFNSSKAKKHFGYVPLVKMDDALKQTLLSFSHLHAKKQKEQ